MTIEKIIQRAHRMKRVDENDIVLCDNCDTPASKDLSIKLSWTCCAACALGEAHAFDPNDFIYAKKGNSTERKAIK